MNVSRLSAINASTWVEAWLESVLFPLKYEQNEPFTEKNSQYEMSSLPHNSTERAWPSADSSVSNNGLMSSRMRYRISTTELLRAKLSPIHQQEH